MQTYMNEKLSIAERVTDLLQQMTLGEKLAQLVGVWTSEIIDEDQQFLVQKADIHLKHGIGHITRIAAVSMLPPMDSASLANTIQRYLVEQTRLGIPAIVHEESCAGYMARGATTFPQAIGLAATWDSDLVQAIADSIRVEMRSVGAHQSLAPVLDIARDPRWGRIEETFGEDPYLVSQIGVAFIKGLQGSDWSKGIAATAKHFLGYGWSEGGMNWAPAHIPERELREVFLTPFVAAIQEGNVATVMNAYQELDGVPAGSSRELLVDLLRDELGFAGVLVSDYFTLQTLVDYHRIADNKVEAAKYGLEAGIDVELPTRDVYGDSLLQALNDGLIDMSLVDASVRRVLEMKFRMGLFAKPYVDVAMAPTVFNTNGQQTLSRKAAEKSIVLLKNDGVLPLSSPLGSIAVIGPAADSIRLLQGDYHYPSHLEFLLEVSDVGDAPAPDAAPTQVDLMEHFVPSTSVLDGIKQILDDTTIIRYSQGCEINSTDDAGISAAVDTARQSDVALVIVGGKSGLSQQCTTGEFIDRSRLGLPGVQQQLVEAVYATGTPTIVVLINGRPLAIPWIDEHIPAIVEAWLPAQEGGHAIANVLFGVSNPGGKLPVSIPRHVGQVPVYYNHKPSGGRSHWYGDYIDSPTTPLYPFGHGLSYTTFSYDDIQLSKREARANEAVDVSCSITNTGMVAGDEVVQLYVHDIQASVTRPMKALKGFKRLHLAPGESVRVSFALPINMLAFYDRTMNYIIEPGTIALMLGSSSQDIRLQTAIEIVGDTTTVEPVFCTPVTLIDSQTV